MKHPVAGEHSHSKERAGKVSMHPGHLREGVRHLEDHHKEERREIKREPHRERGQKES